jgi:hypothetical protein
MGAPTAYVNPAHTQVDVMCYFSVDVSINSEVFGVTGYDLVIGFDEAIIRVNNVFEGSLPSGYPGDTFFYWTDDDQPNELMIQGAMLGGSVNGPGSLARIRFYAPNPGTSPIDLVLVELRDINNYTIPVTCVGGDVVVTSGVAVERTSWGQIKALYLE